MVDTGGFHVADIVLSDTRDGSGTWVTFPYAAGAPEIIRGVGGRWDKPAGAWLVPKGRMDDARKRLPRIAELVRVQQRIDAANGRLPSRPSPPSFRPAGPARTLPTVGADWIALGKLREPEEIAAVRALGCAPSGRAWLAPDEETTGRARAEFAAQVTAVFGPRRYAEADLAVLS